MLRTEKQDPKIRSTTDEEVGLTVLKNPKGTTFPHFHLCMEEDNF
jgi:hypothetical protein